MCPDDRSPSDQNADQNEASDRNFAHSDDGQQRDRVRYVRPEDVFPTDSRINQTFNRSTLGAPLDLRGWIRRCVIVLTLVVLGCLAIVLLAAFGVFSVVAGLVLAVSATLIGAFRSRTDRSADRSTDS